MANRINTPMNAVQPLRLDPAGHALTTNSYSRQLFARDHAVLTAR
jgi:hypothetical protein